jgi:hypothetical protein
MVMNMQYSYDTWFWADLPVLQEILSGESEPLDMSASGVDRDRDVSLKPDLTQAPPPPGYSS